MSWRDQMKPGSFRGVPFFVETAERSGGRRLIKHEFPFRDVPFAEDTGRRPRTFPIEAHVIGADYFTARNALLDALEKSGPGELVHPYYGTLRVAVDGYRVRESVDRGGMALFSIEFFETPKQAPQPSAIADAAAKVQSSAVIARGSVGKEFLARYTPGPLLSSIGDSLRALTLSINNVLTTVAVPMQQLALLKRRVADFESSIGELVSAPEDMVDAVADLFDLLDIFPALLKVYDFDPGVRPPGTTKNRLQEQTNFDATQRMIQRLAVVAAATLAPTQPFDNFTAAVDVRDRITSLLDDQAELASDDTYPALLQLRADLVKAIPGDNGDLPQLVSYTPPATVPSLVLAHRLYGDLALEADLLNRNRVAHPGFVRGGQELEVLSDG